MSWQLASWLLVVGALVTGLAWFERSRPSAKTVALVATLAALAIVGRLLFAATPNIKPTTDIVLFAGYVLGGAPGFAVGAFTALASNIFFGQGPWTPWQMVAWGMTGVGGALLCRLTAGRIGRWPLALACACAGLAFGGFMDIFQWVTFTGTDSLRGYLVIATGSLWFNVAHAVGNFVFALALGPLLLRSLKRFKERFEVRWTDSAALGADDGRGSPLPWVAGVLAVAALAATLAPSSEPARAARANHQAAVAKSSGDAVRDAVKYLRKAQNADGGFGGDTGQGSSQLFTGWTALGLAAAGVNPVGVTKDGKSPIDYMRAHIEQLNDVGEIERTVLVVDAAGLSTRSFGGRDLAAELVEHAGGDGSFDKQTGHVAFGVMALAAIGKAHSRQTKQALHWLLTRQRSDGGFATTNGSQHGDVDITGAALEALGAAGRGSGKQADRAVAFLRGVQQSDGGFGQATGGGGSNAQSTSWALQGIAAAGKSSAAATRYLENLQRLGGSFAYSRSSVQTPVWVTAQVVPALARKPFPLRPLAAPAATASRATAAHRGSHGAAASASQGDSGSSGGDVAASQASDAPPQPASVQNIDRAAQSVDRRDVSHGGGGIDTVYWIAGGLIAAGLAAIAVAVRRRPT